MIARSDLFILVVSASLLAAGILRWQNNVSAMNTAASTAQPAPLAVAPVPAPRVNTSSVVAAVAPAASDVVSVSAQSPQAVTTVQAQSAQSDLTNNNNAAPAAADSSTGSTLQGTATNTQTSEPLYGTYIVQSGDFLGRIAQTYGTSVDTLRQINGITGSLIEIGQEIQYPLPAN